LRLSRPRFQRRYVRELRTVATALGIVRDLDVQRDGLTTYVATLPKPGARAMEPLIAERIREAVRSRLGRDIVTPKGDLVTEELEEA
jgi:CHAD domain-containing protein